MKISMLMTSLIVAMSAINLAACDSSDTAKQKANDMMQQSNEVIESPKDLKDSKSDAENPTPPTE